MERYKTLFQVKIILVEGNSSDTDTDSGDTVSAARRSFSRSASIGGPAVAGGSPGGGVVTTRTYNIYKQYLRRLRLLRQQLALSRGNASPLLIAEYQRVLLLRNNLIRRFPSLPRILLYESLTRRSVPTFGRSPGLNLPVLPVVNRPSFLLSSGFQTPRLTQARPLGQTLLAGRAASGLEGGFTLEGASGFSNTASNGPDTIQVLDGIMRRLQRPRSLSNDPDIIILPPDGPVMSDVDRVSFSRPTANLLRPSLVNTRVPFQGTLLSQRQRQLSFRRFPIRTRPIPISGVF